MPPAGTPSDERQEGTTPACVIITTVGKVELTDAKINALEALGRCVTGSCAVRGTMDGGTLAALVQFGLAERMAAAANDHAGGNRYRISQQGVAVLARLDRSCDDEVLG